MNPSPENPFVPSNEAESLIADISKLMAEAEAMLSESTSHHAEEKIELLREHRASADHCVVASYGAAKAKIAAAGQRAAATVRAYPYEAAALALGLGLVVGACFIRRKGVASALLMPGS